MPTDIEIARSASMLPIGAIAERAGLPQAALHPYGRHIAKVDLGHLETLAGRPDGRLILVTAITPTPAGEGKTTTTVGLGDGLNRIGRRTMICLREPSLGPCFGLKGGAAGGGLAQVLPMEAINLHFTGDIHAIGTANNLLAALIDNHLHWGNALGLDPRRIGWRRSLDVNDRALRQIVTGLGGAANGSPAESGFDITVASEVMAVFCLARDLGDLERRLARMVVGQRRDRRPVTVGDLGVEGALAVLLKDALAPNLVQTIEHSPVFVHGGPFANIAHGCNSVIATKSALKLADYVVTEAGFGADLGAEKFFDIKCRQAGLEPAAAVVVATVRALKMHGGVAKTMLGAPDPDAVERGLANLARHVQNIRTFGVPPVVALNRFVSDTAEEHERVLSFCRDELGVEAHVCNHWAEGSAGIEPLAHAVAALADGGEARFRPLYPAELGLWRKIETVAKEIYAADDVVADKRVHARLAELENQGYGHLPVCIAKTQYSFSTDPARRGAPTHHVVPVREVRLAGGAGFVVCLCGDIMTMPGLPRTPAANSIRLDDAGNVVGLF